MHKNRFLSLLLALTMLFLCIPNGMFAESGGEVIAEEAVPAEEQVIEEPAEEEATSEVVLPVAHFVEEPASEEDSAQAEEPVAEEPVA